VQRSKKSALPFNKLLQRKIRSGKDCEPEVICFRRVKDDPFQIPAEPDGSNPDKGV
jgi:hypothetical protein